MTEYEVLQRNNEWLDNIKQIAEKHSAYFSFEGECFKLGIGGKIIVTHHFLSLYNVLIFMRGFDAYSSSRDDELIFCN